MLIIDINDIFLGFEKYYSEMLLFTSWRDEWKELKPENAEACLEEYSKRQSRIDIIKGIIFPGEKALDLDDINPSDFEDNRPQHIFDTLDPQGEQENADDLDKDIIQDPDSMMFHWHGKNEDEENNHVQFETARYKKINHQAHDDLITFTRQLAPEQMDALTQILNYCKDTVKARTNLDLTVAQLLLIIHGGAGVGKSRTIMAMSQWADKILLKLDDNSVKPRVLICAFTGKAASLVNGITVHTAFGFVPDKKKVDKKHKPLSEKRLAEFRHNLSDLKLIIIDEISLVGADLLYQIHMRLCEIKQKNPTKHLFGGIAMVFVGDLMQIHPVMQSLVFEKPKDYQFKQFSYDCDLWSKFKPHILTHNHRQGEGAIWSNALNRFRVASHTDEDIEILRGRLTDKKFQDETAQHVMYTRKEVKCHNDAMIGAINSPEVVVEDIPKPPKGAKKNWKPPLNKDGHTIADTGFEMELVLKIGVRVTLITNINTSDDLVNGNSGIVIGYERKSDGKIDAVIVQFDQENWGKEQRERYKHYSDKYKSQNGTPIKRYPMEYSPYKHKASIRAHLFQFPLTHGYSSTAHKMQGRTVKAGSNLIIHWHDLFKKNSGMAYVCLGRCEKLEDIYIVGNFDPNGIKCCPRSLEESNRLDQEFENIKELKESKYTDCFTISYLNINRMAPHKEDILLDTWLMKSDIISFGETWLKSDQKIYFDDQDYKGTQANTLNANGKGIASFIKNKYEASWKQVANERFSAILTQTEFVDVISLYLSKDFNWNEFHQTLEEWIVEDRDTVVIGDTNINFLKKSHDLLKFLEKKNFTQLVDRPTHICGGLLDQIYVNRSLMDKNPYHSQRSVYYSDHDEIVLHIPKENKE